MGMCALFSLGVFLKPMADTMGWSRGVISSVALLNWMALGLGSFVWGATHSRIGARAGAVAGGLLLGLGLVLSSQVQTLWQLCVTFGFMVGFSVGAFYAPLTSTAPQWFTARRSPRPPPNGSPRAAASRWRSYPPASASGSWPSRRSRARSPAPGTGAS